MRVILFCQNAYAFGILDPIKKVLIRKGYDYLWFLPEKLLASFPYSDEAFTTRVLDLQRYRSDIIFVPGNEVPYYIRGLKVQIFHGLAGEKRGHFRIRHYFDLYLTQGPYFTERFEAFREQFRNFEVEETGWSKLDVYAEKELQDRYAKDKEELLAAYQKQQIVLYAPTFSPSLTSVPYLLKELVDLARNNPFLVLVKFHDLMDPEWVERYRKEAEIVPNLVIVEEKNIIRFLMIADLLVSDTSSVIYEFILLDKPVISFNSISEFIHWEDVREYNSLSERVCRNLETDPYARHRKEIKAMFHPYDDGKSAERMLEAAQRQIAAAGVPEKRELSLVRKLKIHNIFGAPVEEPFLGEPAKISALLITFNEIYHIEKVLENLNFADEIVVVDSYSTDGTVEVIQNHPKARLIQRPFRNFTDQKSFAMEQASHDWILFTDADERIPDDLMNEIFQAVSDTENPIAAYYFRRSFMFKNQLLRFSGWQSDKNFRLFRKSKCRFTRHRIVHETLEVDGPTAVLENKLIHYSYRTYREYRGKMIRYGQMKAIEEYGKGKRAYWFLLLFRPAYKFISHFLIRLGFLDGKKGLIISYLNALGVYARYREMGRMEAEATPGKSP